MNESVKLDVYNQSINITGKFRPYVMDIISNHFDNLEKVHGAVITVKSFNDEDFQKNYLQPFYHFPKNQVDKPFEDIKNTLHSSYIDDDKLLFRFYKNAGYINDSKFILTKSHKGIYESIEKRINSCKVLDIKTVREYNSKNGDNITKCEKGSCEECKDIQSGKCKLPSQLMTHFEDNCLIPKEEEDWLIVVFPYFFLSKLIGAYSVVLKGEFDIDVIEDYITQLQNAKSVFYRGIINNIANDWINNKENEEKNFIDYLKYFIDLKESHSNMHNKENRLFESIKEINESSECDFKIYYPHTININNKALLICIKYKEKPYFFEYGKNELVPDNTMRIRTFELVSHIQWLWEIWNNNKTNNNGGKEN